MPARGFHPLPFRVVEAGRERVVWSGDLRIRVVEGGVVGAVPVVLVHGFPDTADVWGEVARRLGERFWVVRYDVRGAGGSDAPVGDEGYLVERLVEDLVAVVEVVGRPVHLVGHDWGSVQGWAAVASRPELFLSFTSVSGPDLGHVAEWVRRNRLRPVKVAKVLWRSWYIAGFKVPVVPELVWRVPLVRRWLRAGRRELVNGLGMYRANVGRSRRPVVVGVRVHQIELAKDPYVVREHLEAAEPWVEQLSRSRLDAGHWAPRTHPESVARHIEDAVDGRGRGESGNGAGHPPW